MELELEFEFQLELEFELEFDLELMFVLEVVFTFGSNFAFSGVDNNRKRRGEEVSIQVHMWGCQKMNLLTSSPVSPIFVTNDSIPATGTDNNSIVLVYFLVP